MKKISDICTLFIEDNQVVGILYQNGVTQFYSVRPASKQDIESLLEVERAEDK